MRLRKQHVRRIDELTRGLRTWVDGAPPVLDQVLSEVRDLTGADRSMAFGFVPEEATLRLDFLDGEGFSKAAFRSGFDALLRRQTVGWAAYNPFRPERAQRNRALSVVRLLGWERLRQLPLYEQVMVGLKLGE